MSVYEEKDLPGRLFIAVYSTPQPISGRFPPGDWTLKVRADDFTSTHFRVTRHKKPYPTSGNFQATDPAWTTINKVGNSDVGVGVRKLESDIVFDGEYMTVEVVSRVPMQSINLQTPQLRLEIVVADTVSGKDIFGR